MQTTIQVIEAIKADETFLTKMKGRLGFVPNEVEGLGELATYMDDRTHLRIINKALSDNGIINTDGFHGVIYGSIGSSSSQLFVPLYISSAELEIMCNSLFNECHKNDKLRQDEMINIFQCITQEIDDEIWTIVLIPNNVVKHKYIPFYVLESLYLLTYLPITISNCIAHTFYKKNKTYQDVVIESQKMSATLFDLFTNDLVMEHVKSDTKNNGSLIYDFKNEVFDIEMKRYKNIIVIPRTKIAGSFIDNGWDKTLLFESNFAETPDLMMYTSILDIGGGKTNIGYSTSDVKLITSNISKEMDSSFPKGQCFPICTGRIRTDVEEIMKLGHWSSLTYVQFTIIPFYVKYFKNSKYLDEYNNDKISLIVII
jgi:hypothetical protein